MTEEAGLGSKKTSSGKMITIVIAAIASITASGPAHGQTANSGMAPEETNGAVRSAAPYQQTTDDYNQRLAALNRQLFRETSGLTTEGLRSDYRIGADDLLDISVLEAPELDRSPRVSSSGQISLGLVGTVQAAGLTTRELEIVTEELLRRDYIKDPHVSVQVHDMQSHPVSVFGAVKKPGVFQIREPKTVIELLSMAEGLDVDAGDTVIVEHRGDISTARDLSPSADSVDSHLSNANSSSSATGSAPPGIVIRSNTAVIDLKKLLSTGDPKLNVMVYPGDVVKVPVAELVYVVGEVAKPGGFELKSNENVSVLQAIALAQGLTHTSASDRSKIIRTDPATGNRQEIPIDLNKILAGKIGDPMLQPRDIVFVPNSKGRAALYRGMEAAISIGSGVAIYRP
jgi:polysaccharide biosynthesis/export protein